MDQVVRWGIIGAGGIARRRTIPALNLISNAQVTAVMDKNEQVLEELREEFGIEYGYTQEAQLLENPDVDAVYIASPVAFHKDQARRVLDAGKHLLIEKPQWMAGKRKSSAITPPEKDFARASAC